MFESLHFHRIEISFFEKGFRLYAFGFPALLISTYLTIDIKTGKYIVKALEEKDFEELEKAGHDLNLDTWFDFDYEDCIDEKRKPIELNY